MTRTLFESKKNLLNVLLNATRFQRIQNNTIQCANLNCKAHCQIFVRHVTRENAEQFASQKFTVAPQRKNDPQSLFRPSVDIHAFLDRRFSQNPDRTSIPLYIAVVSGTHEKHCDFPSIAFPFAESDGEDLDLEEIGCADASENSDSANLNRIQHRLSKIAHADRGLQTRIDALMPNESAARLQKSQFLSPTRSKHPRPDKIPSAHESKSPSSESLSFQL